MVVKVYMSGVEGFGFVGGVCFFWERRGRVVVDGVFFLS